jgi:4-hydroxybenzoyl-CoA thioesterase
MVDTRAKFYIPSTHGGCLTFESRTETFKSSSLEVMHKVLKKDALAIEAWETRVLVGKHPDDPGKLKSAAVPQEIIDKFMQG